MTVYLLNEVAALTSVDLQAVPLVFQTLLDRESVVHEDCVYLDWSLYDCDRKRPENQCGSADIAHLVFWIILLSVELSPLQLVVFDLLPRLLVRLEILS